MNELGLDGDHDRLLPLRGDRHDHHGRVLDQARDVGGPERERELVSVEEREVGEIVSGPDQPLRSASHGDKSLDLRTAQLAQRALLDQLDDGPDRVGRLQHLLRGARDEARAHAVDLGEPVDLRPVRVLRAAAPAVRDDRDGGSAQEREEEPGAAGVEKLVPDGGHRRRDRCDRPDQEVRQLAADRVVANHVIVHRRADERQELRTTRLQERFADDDDDVLPQQ